jgi:23S rRNA (cytosine1962-C5)-methyltransferase
MQFRGKPRRSPRGRAERVRRPDARAVNRAPDSTPPLDRLEAALGLRARLLNDPLTTGWRVFNGAADGIDGLVIEKLGDVLVIQLHEERLALDERAVHEVCQAALERLHARAVYRKVFPRDRSGGSHPNPAGEGGVVDLESLHHDPTPWIGMEVEPELTVIEAGTRFLVRPYDGYSTGIFLEHRTNRASVRGLAAGQRVLNAFAYTCGFTVAAALGQAVETVSVDISRKSLELGQRNLTANDIPPERHTFVCSDIFDYYRRAQRQQRRFDLIILDPPTFARTRRPARVFSITEDLDRLAAGAVALLEPGGHLLLCTNHRPTSHRRLEEAVTAAADSLGRRATIVERPELPEDFRADPAYAKSILARVT